MTKLLYILRHAKAELASDHAEDHARPLSERGRENATALGAILRRFAHQPQHVLCSNALRTRQTHELLGLDVPVAYSERLYLASAGELLAAIHALPESCDSVLIIGHNPGLHELVALLTHHAADDAYTEQLRVSFPTCALATLSFNNEWAHITPDSGMLESLILPQK